VLDETYDEGLAAYVGRQQWKVVLLSTPHGKPRFFYQAWEDESTWLRVRSMLMNVRESSRSSWMKKKASRSGCSSRNISIFFRGKQVFGL